MSKVHDFLAAVRVAAEVRELRPDYRALLLVAEGLRPGPSDDWSESLLAEGRGAPGPARRPARAGLGRGVPGVRGEAAADPAERDRAAAPAARPAPDGPADRRVQRGLGPARRSRSAARTSTRTSGRCGWSGRSATSRSRRPRPASRWSTRPSPARWCGGTTPASPAAGGTGGRPPGPRLTTATTRAVFVLDALGPMSDDALAAAGDALADRAPGRQSTGDGRVPDRLVATPQSRSDCSTARIVASVAVAARGRRRAPRW